MGLQDPQVYVSYTNNLDSYCHIRVDTGFCIGTLMAPTKSLGWGPFLKGQGA